MYNRTNAYKCLGFDSFKDLNSFNLKIDVKGNYVSDDKVIDKVIENLNENDAPKFIFAATIQNHDPYDNNSKNYINRKVNVTSKELDSVEMEILSNYSQGVYDADNALGKLIEEVKKNKRPTLLYYFGDHLPRLGEPKGIYDIYEKLGYIDKNKKPEQDPKFYETPIITWSNYKKMNKLPVPISPNQLAVEILRDSGIKYPNYFNYLLRLREKYPFLNRSLVDKNELMNDEIINNYYMIQYDIMFGNQYILKDTKY
jgi:phosphoglycerol transferase MdoB-like AlkP superfamily enzyme